MKPSRRMAVSLLLVAGIALSAALVRADLTTSDKKCLAATAKAVQDFALAKLKALQKCRESAADPSVTQCPDAKATLKIAKAKAKLDKALAKKKCSSAKFDPSNLGFTGCPAIGGCEGSTATLDAYRTCVGCATGEVVDSLATAESPGACGNGSVDAGEECDDGNTTDGDGCSSGCKETCDCCSLNPTQVKTTVLVSGSATCGELRNFRCSNVSKAACTQDSDCDFGYCNAMFSKCSADPNPNCTSAADCTGTCKEQLKCSVSKELCTADSDCPEAETCEGSSGLPLDLQCGGLYTGGGNNSVPLPFSLPDRAASLAAVTSCDADSGQITVGPVTQGQATNRTCTEGRRCSSSNGTCNLDSDCPATETCEDRCLFGAPLPVPNVNTPAVSVCTRNVLAEDIAGSGTCSGTTDISLALRSVVFLNGDLLSSTVGSVAGGVPGLQPCPLCTKQCNTTGGPCETDADCKTCTGGARASFFCGDDSDCTGGTCVVTGESCSATTSCLGGPGGGDPCTPGTSGPDVLNEGFPTSHDCALDSLNNITSSTGGLPVSLSLTTGSATLDSVDRPTPNEPIGRRTFCGFCRDVTTQGTLCFEGDPRTDCPVAGSGTATPCTSNGECSTPFESCVQTNPGAFGRAAATTMTMTGSSAECLADGTAKEATVVSAFCIPPTFNQVVDAAGDLPGPGAVSILVTSQLLQ